jgi:hypothetical protein
MTGFIFRAYTHSDFSKQVQLKSLVDGVETPVDLTGATFSMQARTSREAQAVAFTPTITVTGEETGEFTISIPFEALEDVPPGTYYSDIVMTVSGRPTRILGGRIVVEQQVTHA